MLRAASCELLAVLSARRQTHGGSYIGCADALRRPPCKARAPASRARRPNKAAVFRRATSQWEAPGRDPRARGNLPSLASIIVPRRDVLFLSPPATMTSLPPPPLAGCIGRGRGTALIAAGFLRASRAHHARLLECSRRC